MTRKNEGKLAVRYLPPAMKTHTSLLLAALAGACSFTSASAATLGYWRFESSPGLLSATEGPDLVAGAVSPTQVASSFGTVPFTGATNANAASFGGTANFGVVDPSWVLGSDFTIEAFVRVPAIPSATVMIASEFNQAAGANSWFLGINNAGQLRFGTSANGNGSTNLSVNSSFVAPLAANTTYYVAAVFNSGSVTFHMQDMTNAGSLLSNGQSIANTSVFAAAVNLNIGSAVSTNTPTDRNFFTGIIDEVRLSDNALAANQLLVASSIPEPASFATIVGAAFLACGLGRRRIRRD